MKIIITWNSLYEAWKCQTMAFLFNSQPLYNMQISPVYNPATMETSIR